MAVDYLLAGMGISSHLHPTHSHLQSFPRTYSRTFRLALDLRQCWPRVLQQLNDQLLSRPNESDGYLRPSILNANAVTVVAYSPVKSGMNTKSISAHWRWLPSFR